MPDLFSEYFGRYFHPEELGAGVNRAFDAMRAEKTRAEFVTARGNLIMDAMNAAKAASGEMGTAPPNPRTSNGVAKAYAFSRRMVRQGAKYGLVAGGGAVGYTGYRKQQQRSNAALNSVAVTNGGQGFYRNGNF